MGTETVVPRLPYCDYCQEQGIARLARYDGATHDRVWAFMCEEHFQIHGVGLGDGLGQRLLLKDEMSHRKTLNGFGGAPPCLKFLHPASSLSKAKLAKFRQVSSEELVTSLEPGQPGALKVRADGTVLDGHHRLVILQERGIDINCLPREMV